MTAIATPDLHERKSYSLDPHRLLPQSPDAEKGVLSSFLIAQREVGALCAEKGVTSDQFFIPAHRILFELMMELWSEGEKGDFVTITQILRDRKKLDQCGGPAFITELFTFLPTAANAAYYIEILSEKYILREIIKSCTDHIARAYDEQDDVYGVLSSAAASLANIAMKRASESKSWRAHLVDKLTRMEEGEPDEDVIKTHIRFLDENSPLRLGSMPLLVGEEKAGKSILSLTIAANVASDGHRVLYFSLEDSSKRVVDRMFANQSQVPIALQHGKRMNEGDFARVSAATSRMQNWKFDVRSDVFDLDGIVATIRQHKTKHTDLCLVAIDYAQLVKTPRRRNDNREQEVALTSRTFRLLSIELNIAIIFLAQLNKDGDARESTALEKDMTARWEIKMIDESQETQGKRGLRVGRQRDGESNISTVVAFLGAQARVENIAREENERPAAPSSNPPRPNPYRSRRNDSHG